MDVRRGTVPENGAMRRTVWAVSPRRVYEACMTPAMRALIDPAAGVPTNALMPVRTAEHANVVMALLENAGTTFFNREQAMATLFDKYWGGGGGMGLPIYLKEEIIDALASDLDNPDTSTLTGAFAMLTAALTAIGTEPAARDRVAYASTLSHAESTWVQETAFQLLRVGVEAAAITRETSVGAHKRVDLALGLTPIEFKSTFASFSVEDSAAHTAAWIGRDIAKIREARHPGIFVLTIAQLVDVDHRRIVFASRKTRGMTASQIREEGIAAYNRFLEGETGNAPVHLEIGTASGPAQSGTINLDALIVRVPDH